MCCVYKTKCHSCHTGSLDGGAICFHGMSAYATRINKKKKQARRKVFAIGAAN